MYTAEFKTAATQFFAAADTFAKAAGVDCNGIRIAIERTPQGSVLRASKPLDGNLFTINRNEL